MYQKNIETNIKPPLLFDKKYGTNISQSYYFPFNLTDDDIWLMFARCRLYMHMDEIPPNVLDSYCDNWDNIINQLKYKYFPYRDIEFLGKKIKEDICVGMASHLNYDDIVYYAIKGIRQHSNTIITNEIEKTFPKSIIKDIRWVVSPETLTKLKDQLNMNENKLSLFNVLNEILLNEFDYSDAIKLEKAAIDHYGETLIPSHAGYITPNGYLLDFSYGSGRRDEDHRNIGFLVDELGIDLEEYGTDKWKHSSCVGMRVAIALGFIRYMPESNGFDMVQMPTQDQFTVLRHILKMKDGKAIFDLGNNVHLSTNTGTPVEFILTSIKDYYKHGIHPQPYKYFEDYY